MKKSQTNNTVATMKKEFTRLRSSDPNEIPSEVLARLIEEIRNEETLKINAYNRFHNRHNRTR